MAQPHHKDTLVDEALNTAESLFSEYGFELRPNYPEFTKNGGIKWYRSNSLNNDSGRPDIYIYSSAETNEIIFEFVDALRPKSSRLTIEITGRLKNLLSDIVGENNIRLTTK